MSLTLSHSILWPHRLTILVIFSLRLTLLTLRSLIPRPTSRNGVSLSPGLKSFVLTWDIQWIFKPLAIRHFNISSLVQRMNLQIYMLIEWPSSSLCFVAQSYLIFEILWTVACQAPLSMAFFRQEYWNGLPFCTSRWSPQTTDQTCVSSVRFFTHWAIKKAPSHF